MTRVRFCPPVHAESFARSSGGKTPWRVSTGPAGVHLRESDHHPSQAPSQTAAVIKARPGTMRVA